ncbi:helix-turn-helix domain-containing protein [Roseateles sp. NT4]|uniref:helix-turn-helix domain-containing protein n=1 Tax=Roseateles sp. NT4 TaxID=3453715 RepID=UPI003EECF1A2
MKDTIRLAADLGAALKDARKRAGLSITDLAKQAGRVRDVIYRLEAGGETSLSSLFAVLSVLHLQIKLESTGMPTLEQVQARFSPDADEDE